jgi:hypothetical protein
MGTSSRCLSLGGLIGDARVIGAVGPPVLVVGAWVATKEETEIVRLAYRPTARRTREMD